MSDVTLPVRRTTGDTLEDRLTDNAYQNILPARYLQKDENGELTETQEELFERVAKNIAVAEAVHTDHITEEEAPNTSYDDVERVRAVQEAKRAFQEQMEHLKFMPNSPTLMNAGGDLQQLSACFVMSPEDDLSDIHETAKDAAEVFQSGGGCGYGFWQLRPYGDSVGSTGGIASGPITFMRTFDQMCETIAQGGTRRGAQMAVMKVSHPDVIEFIHSKNKDVSLAHTLKLNDPDDYTYTSFSEALEEARELIDDEGRVPKHLRNAVEGHLSNFNISVGVTDGFMEAVNTRSEYTFENPRTNETHIATEETEEMWSRYGLGQYVTPGEPLEVPAHVVWGRIVEGAHENGEPGVIFIDRANAEHSFDVEEHPEYAMKATNPCGEQPLMEYEACNLGHINLSTIVHDDATHWRSYEGDPDSFILDAIDWGELDERIRLGVRFLDNVVTMSDFPVEEISETVRDNRKIGLGIMGLAQLYVQLGVPYGSDLGNEIARELMMHINQRAKEVSHTLTDKRGSFPNWADSKYADPEMYPEWFEQQTGIDAAVYPEGFPIRNHNVTTIAPTGTTSMVANTTGGCEPIYNVAYYKNVTDDVQGDEMLVEFDDYFLDVLEANDIDVDEAKEEAELQMESNEFYGVGGLVTVPDEIGELFVTTDQVTPKQHASVQCACQAGVDSAISKTINAPAEATVDETNEAFRFVYENGGKGVTYYRDGTRSKQVLTTRADNADFSDGDVTAEDIREVAEAQFGGMDAVLEQLGVSLPSEPSDDTTAKKPRPDALNGVSQRIETGYGRVYVTVNEDPETGEPFELFANMGHSGGFTNSFTEALAKVISTSLRSGVDPDEIIGELCGTRSPKIDWDNQEKIQSIPDAIGTALRRYHNDEIPSMNVDDIDAQMQAEAEELVAEMQSSPVSGGAVTEPCPDCGELSVYETEGCKKCDSCGWSEC